MDSGLEEELAELKFEDEPGSKEDEDYLTLQNRRLLSHLRERHDEKGDQRLRSAERRASDATRPRAPWSPWR